METLKSWMGRSLVLKALGSPMLLFRRQRILLDEQGTLSSFPFGTCKEMSEMNQTRSGGVWTRLLQLFSWSILTAHRRTGTVTVMIIK